MLHALVKGSQWVLRQMQTRVVTNKVLYYNVYPRYYNVSDQLSSVTRHGMARDNNGTPELLAEPW